MGTVSLPAGARPSRLLRIGSFFKKRTNCKSASDEQTVILEILEILQILERAVQDELSALIELESKKGIASCKTSFMSPPDGELKITEGGFLHIATIQPESENRLIEIGAIVILTFFMDGYKYWMKSPVIVVTDDGFCLNPNVLNREKDRRGVARFDVGEVKVKVKVLRESGIPISDAHALNISVGGFTFTFDPSRMATLRDNCLLHMTFWWGENYQNTASFSGRFIRNGKSSTGESNCIVQFSKMKYKQLREIGELVTFVERQQIQKENCN